MRTRDREKLLRGAVTLQGIEESVKRLHKTVLYWESFFGSFDEDRFPQKDSALDDEVYHVAGMLTELEGYLRGAEDTAMELRRDGLAMARRHLSEKEG